MAKEEKAASPRNPDSFPKPFHSENILKFPGFCADTKVHRGT
jgi:hypothetical protein